MPASAPRLCDNAGVAAVPVGAGLCLLGLASEQLPSHGYECPHHVDVPAGMSEHALDAYRWAAYVKLAVQHLLEPLSFAALDWRMEAPHASSQTGRRVSVFAAHPVSCPLLVGNQRHGAFNHHAPKLCARACLEAVADCAVGLVALKKPKTTPSTVHVWCTFPRTYATIPQYRSRGSCHGVLGRHRHVLSSCAIGYGRHVGNAHQRV